MDENKIKNHLKNQYFSIGIAEQNLISVGAGLALGEKKPFLYGISTFVTLRCYEQIVVDLCNMNLGCTIIGSGPGLTYASDGPTHHSIQDISIMRIMPNMTIFNQPLVIANFVLTRTRLICLVLEPHFYYL